DAGDERLTDTIAQVEEVLAEIGADRTPRIQVYNKLDLLENAFPRLERNERGQVSKVWLSALSGQGLELLDQAIDERLSGEMQRHTLHLSATEAGLRARLFEFAKILKDETSEEGGWDLEIEIPAKDARFLLDYGLGPMVEEEVKRHADEP
ncbi:MAG: hypothetical protein PHE55_22460, partial [Methylococcaceae bacterium]|nr:hypothetical protein [Methylococcaceae bacterium]